MDDESGLTCGAVYLLKQHGTCYACGQATPLFALMALPPFTFDDDGEAPLNDDGFTLSNVVAIQQSLAAELAVNTGGRMRPDTSQTARLAYWMNHCERCDAKQGDHFVQGPDGPFWPHTDEEMDAIQGVLLKGPFRFDQVDCSDGPMSHWLARKHGVASERTPPKAPKASKTKLSARKA